MKPKYLPTTLIAVYLLLIGAPLLAPTSKVISLWSVLLYLPHYLIISWLPQSRRWALQSELGPPSFQGWLVASSFIFICVLTVNFLLLALFKKLQKKSTGRG